MIKSRLFKPGMWFTPGIKKIKIEYSNGYFKTYIRGWKTFWIWKYNDIKTKDYLLYVQKDIKEKFNLNLNDLYLIDDNTLDALNKL